MGPDPADQATAPRHEPPRARRLFPLRRLLAMSLLAILIYAFVVFIGDARAVVALIENVDILWVLSALGLVAVGYVLRTIRWTYLIRSLGHPAPAYPSGTAFLSGFALAVTPGKVGEFVKVYYQNREAGTPYETSVAVTFAERALDLIALCLVFAAGLLVTDSLELRYALIPIAVAVAVILVVRSRRLPATVLAWTGRYERLGKASAATLRTQQNMAHVLRGQRLVFGTALGVLAWALEPLAMAQLARGLGLDVSLAACAVVFAGSTLFSVITFIPGGLASYEGSSVVLLNQFFGLSLTSAAALTLLTRLCTLWFGVLIGILALILLRARNRVLAAPRPNPSPGKPEG